MKSGGKFDRSEEGDTFPRWRGTMEAEERKADYAPVNCSIFSASFFLNFPSVLVIFPFYPRIRHPAGLFGRGRSPFAID
jgi:hypothetical protein